jgi:hypothetical protein
MLPGRLNPTAAWAPGREFCPDTRIELFPILPCPGRKGGAKDTFLPSLQVPVGSETRAGPEICLYFGLPFSSSFLLEGLKDIVKRLWAAWICSFKLPGQKKRIKNWNMNWNMRYMKWKEYIILKSYPIKISMEDWEKTVNLIIFMLSISFIYG